MRPKSFFVTHLWEIILSLTTLLLCLRNFTPQTFLVGWDNLMPELDIWINLKRSLSVWQTTKVLVWLAVGPHTDLIRQLILFLYPYSPINLIRYLWHFAMIFGYFWCFFFGLKVASFKNPPPLCLFISSILAPSKIFGTTRNFSAFWGFFPG